MDYDVVFLGSGHSCNSDGRFSCDWVSYISGAMGFMRLPISL